MRLELDNIKVKVFFKILATGDFLHFSKSKNKQKKLEKVWGELQNEYEIICDDKKKGKQISLTSRIESLLNKFKAIAIACYVLRFKFDESALEILKEHYFKIDLDNYHESIDKIESDSESILIQIEKLKSQLPEEDKEVHKTERKTQNLDEVILGYCAFIGGGFLKPNDVTVTEFLGLKRLFESKLNELEKKKDVR